MHPMLTIAILAAREAGNFINKNYEKFAFFENKIKGQSHSIVNIDKLAEQIIVKTIHKYYPTHFFLTRKKSEIVSRKNSVYWIINPLDGALNFIKHSPYFATSIVARNNNRTEIVVVYNPMFNELFTAVRGHGAQLNNYRLRLKNSSKLNSSIIATGFPFKSKQYLDTYVNIVSKLFRKCADFRYTGSVVLDLAFVAAGRVDGFLQIGLNPWDFMAGELLVREAGGVVTDFIGNHDYLLSGNLLAGSPNIVKKIVSEIQIELGAIEKLKYN